MALIKCKVCGNEISKNAKACPKCGEKPRRTSLFTWIVAIFGVAWLISYAVSGGGNVSSAPPQKDVAIQNTVLDFEWAKGGFDNVMVADFTIENKNAFPIKDIEVACEHTAPSGTRIDSNTKTIYEVVAANSKKKVKNFNMGFIAAQAQSSSCRIKNLVIGG